MKYFLSFLLLVITQNTIAQSCSGVPSPGTASATTLIPCGNNANDTLILQGYSTGNGLLFQWMSSANATTWTAIAGATNTTYDFTAAGTVYYKNRVVCSTSGDTTYSNYLPIVYDSLCPCLPLYEYAYDYNLSINLFSVTGYAGSTINDGFLSNGAVYSLRPYTVNMEQGHIYSGQLVFGSVYGTNENEIWIDFNDDGIFEASEDVSGVFSDPTGTAGGLSFNINIPLYAPPGIHKMRVRNAFTSGPVFSTQMDPCYYGDYLSGTEIEYLNGSTRDYSVNVVYFPPCQSMPDPGIAVTNSCTICGGGNLSLANSIASSDSFGLIYQWQTSVNGLIWSNLAGATTTSYSYVPVTKQEYRLQVGCTVSGDTTYSNTVNEYYESSCPCMPIYSQYGTGFQITCFTSAVYTGTPLHDTSYGYFGGTGYNDRSCILPQIQYQRGGSYNDTVFLDGYYNQNLYQTAQVWIDFNDDGIFASSEAVSSIYACTNCIALYPTINIPSAADTGVHRMRVRYAQSSTTLAPPPQMDPCAGNYAWDDYNFGNALDYLVYIHASVAAAAFTSSASQTCQGSCISFINTSSGIADSIKWVVSGAAIANPHADTVNACFATTGNYTATLYVFSGSVADSATQAITVNETPAQIEGVIYLCTNGIPNTATFTDATVGGGWSSGNTNYLVIDQNTGVITLGTELSTYFDTSTTQLFVPITYTLPTGCNTTYLVQVRVCEDVPLVNSNSKITLSPNPANTTIDISASDKMTSIVITNPIGQIVYSANCNNRKITANVSTLPAGVYMVTVNGINEGKFIKL